MPTEGFDDALGSDYRLLEVIGRGATGEVWKAANRRTEATVAAKLLLPEHTADRELLGRFVAEGRVLEDLRGEGIVQVLDMVAERNRYAIIMEYVDGGSLGDALRQRGTMPPALAVGVCAIVLDALATAHAQGVVHRDVKPDNVLVTEGWWQLQRGSVRIVDFGIAEILTNNTGVFTGGLGTPEYMAPELQVRGSAEGPADVYGVGIMLYELLSGRTPFRGSGSAMAVARRHVDFEVPRLDVPESLWLAIAAMLAKDPDERPDAKAAAKTLRGLSGSVASMRPLPKAASPASFEAARGPMTLLRPSTEQAPREEPAPATPMSGEMPADFDLGAPSDETTVKPLPLAPTHRARPERERPAELRPGWQNPWLIGIVVGALVLIGGAVFFVSSRGKDGGTPSTTSSSTAPVDVGPASAQQDDQALSSGLTISRSAAYDSSTGAVDLTITYTAQKAPLEGPFLEVLPPISGEGCPPVTWTGKQQPENLSSTGITTDCAYAIDPGTVPAKGSVQVEASVALDLSAGGDDASSALDQWLAGAAEATKGAVEDPDLSGPAYPVQRMTDISMVVPDRTLVGKGIRVAFYPVWPSGEDRTDPIYISPTSTSASSLLQAISGGLETVKIDGTGCGGTVFVDPDGLGVSARGPVDACELSGQIGNFTDITSNPISVTGRGS